MILRLVLSIAAFLALAGCGSEQYPDACYDQYGLTHRAGNADDCPVPRETKEAVGYLAEQLEVDPGWWAGHDVVYISEPYFDYGPGLAVGIAYLYDRMIVIAKTDYGPAILRHELLHVYFFHTEGDPDYWHVSPLWALVN